MFLTQWVSWLTALRTSNERVSIASTDVLDDVDLSWIQNMASIGDSYAAGLGSGNRVDFSCSRYSAAYPNILHQSFRNHGWSTTHQSLACSGADSSEVLAKQIPALNTSDFDLITISAGGNDIGLTPILSDCVYQFYMAGEDACQKSIKEANEKITSDLQLFRNVTRLIEAAKPYLNSSHGLVYVTGYARFFGTGDNTCDNVTWAVWRKIEQNKQYLKLEMREALNEMVLAVNDVLRRAVEAAGPNVRFVDYDATIAKSRGRYCEIGVHEPAPNRRGLVFYEWDTVDKGENKTGLQNSTGYGVPKGSFEGEIAEQVNKTLQEHPDWTFDPDKGFVKKNKTTVGGEGIIEDTIHWLIPDSYKRVFHLRPDGQQLIAGMIRDNLEACTRSRVESTEIEEL
ncbi:fibronectin type III domain protein [Stagonosporopsis vannaccii]|nr:fibronectin type III domain protein [Stagonosporopsis vannaccii]